MPAKIYVCIDIYDLQLLQHRYAIYVWVLVYHFAIRFILRINK